MCIRDRVNVDELIERAIDDFRTGKTEVFETLIKFLFKSNISMQFRLVNLEKELGEFKREFRMRELTSEKFQDLLMSDDNLED